MKIVKALLKYRRVIAQNRILHKERIKLYDDLERYSLIIANKNEEIRILNEVMIRKEYEGKSIL